MIPPPMIAPVAIDTGSRIAATAPMLMPLPKIRSSPAGMPLGQRRPPNHETRMIAKAVRPIAGVRIISSAGRMAMNVTDTPASVPSSAARGVTRRTNGAAKPPTIRMKLWMNTHASPASQPFTGSFAESEIGSMITKTTMNMCGTEMPDGSAHTSVRPVRFARRWASHA